MADRTAMPFGRIAETASVSQLAKLGWEHARTQLEHKDDVYVLERQLRRCS